MHRPRFRCRSLVVAILAAGALAGRAAADPDLTSLADQVFVMVNQQRAARGLKPLVRASPLDRAAEEYAGRMAGEDFFAHVAPDGSQPYDRIHGAGYQGIGWGENIAAGLDTAEAVMDAWMNSPAHASNILNVNYGHIGIGVAVGGTYGIYWVQDFGSPVGTVPGPWAPHLDRVSPTAARPGELVTLEGTNLGSPGGVTFNGVPAYVEEWGTRQVVARVPATGGLGPVVVTNSYGGSNGLAFGSPTPPPATSPGTPTPPSSTPPSSKPPSSTPPSSTPPPVPPTPPTVPTPAPPTTPTPPTTPSPAPKPTPAPTPAPTPPSTPPTTPAPPTAPTTPPPTPPSPPSVPVITPPPTTPGPSPLPSPSPVPDRTPSPSPAPLPPAVRLRFNYLTPRNGASGTVAQLYGTGFGAAAGQIQIAGASATVLSWSDTQIVLRIEGPRPGRRGLRIIRADGTQGPVIAFRITR